jgi:hypothetical protein
MFTDRASPPGIAWSFVPHAPMAGESAVVAAASVRPVPRPGKLSFETTTTAELREELS